MLNSCPTRLRTLSAVCALTGAVSTALAVTSEVPDYSATALQQLDAYPAEIQLVGARAETQLVVTGIYGKAARRDLTRRARLTIADMHVARIEGQRILAVSNGETLLSILAAGHQMTVPVRVTGVDRPDPIRFQFETLAVITKQGCNSGSCHGSPQGKGGFSLSLFAYDPNIDQQSLVRGGLNRRVNLLDPDESLLLKKPTLRIAHGGGKRLRKGEFALSILRRWIQEGADVTSSSDIRCHQIRITPSEARIVYAPDREQQLNVTAFFSDGTERDVTRLATYSTSDREVATVDSGGMITCHQKGQAAITIRYLNHLESVHMTHVIHDDQFVWPDQIELNEIDRLVNDKLRLLQYPPSSICSDATFLRRIYLDLTGLLPGKQRTRQFLADPSLHKRSHLVNELLKSDQFARYQSLQMADLLHVNAGVLGEDRAQIFADWIADAIKTGKPYDRFTRELLTAVGNSDTVGPANYFAAIASTQEVSEATAQIFMGSRIQCAKCHNHPFENWTQNDYYRLAAVFHRIQRRGAWINLARTGELRHPKSDVPMQPWGTESLTTPTEELSTDTPERRVIFAAWLTRKDNPFFAHTAVNRIWSQLFGSGIVNPIDDFRSSNPPVNVELIDRLADEFRHNNFDREHIIRWICNSATYQRSTHHAASNELDEDLFSHARIRLLSAEQLMDAIGMVTGALPASAEIARIDAQNREDFERSAAKRKADQPAWESQQRALLHSRAMWHGDWWSLAPYVAQEDDKALDKVFPPEEAVLNHADRHSEPWENLALWIDPGVKLGGRRWRLEHSWKCGQKISLTDQANATHFLYHRVYLNRVTDVHVKYQSIDKGKVWFNGESLADLSNQWEATSTLRPGWNHFLIKVVNTTDRCEINFSLDSSEDKHVPQAVPGPVAVALVMSEKQRSVSQIATLEDYYLDLDEAIRVLRKKVTLGQRFEFASQRPYPAQTPFLKAFGQPERTSPCACDRSDEPNLEQAIQLLNGRVVFDLVQRGVQTYKTMPDEELVESLCLAAFTRFPSDNERVEMLQYLSDTDDRDQAIGDLLWAVMATQEFLFQH